VLPASSASTSDRPDPLCSEIAAFANAAANDGTRKVRLLTDWGAVFTRKERDEELMYSISCEHQTYAPAQALCAYLLKNASVEFMGINVRRALSCMGKRVSGRSPTDDDQLPASFISQKVLGVRVDAELLLEFAEATDSSPPTLTITALGR